MPDTEHSYKTVRCLIHELIEHDPDSPLLLQIDGQHYEVVRIENTARDGWAVVLVAEDKKEE